MGLELDWLEREERYRRRVLRLIIVSVVLVAGLIGTLAFLRTKAVKEAQATAASASQAARQAAVKQQRDTFVADSSATANRYAGFVRTHAATPLESTPLLQIPLAHGTAIAPFVRDLWSEYVHVLDPQTTAEQESDWYRQYYIDVMNDGPLRPRAVLLPSMKQESTKLVLQKATFTDITIGQVAVGMREAPQEVRMDSLAAAAPSAELPTSPPAATAPPAAATPPPAPPSEPAPPESTPPPPEPDITPPAVAPPDTTPKP